MGHAWYKLTTRDMGPRTRCLEAKGSGFPVPPAQKWQHPLPDPPTGGSAALANFTLVEQAIREVMQAGGSASAAAFVRLAYQCAATFRSTDYQGGCNGPHPLCTAVQLARERRARCHSTRFGAHKKSVRIRPLISVVARYHGLTSLFWPERLRSGMPALDPSGFVAAARMRLMETMQPLRRSLCRLSLDPTRLVNWRTRQFQRS